MSREANEGNASFLQDGSTICLAGKNQIAVDCLEHLISIGIPHGQLCIVGNRDDSGKNTWQPSLLFAAAMHGVRIVTLESLYDEKRLWFFSVEYDRLIKPACFASKRLYNIHFSLLPAYRGVCTSVWPIVKSEKHTGVTFHEIDAGIDTGPILLQRAFEIGPDWTARDLYFAYQENGAALFRDVLRGLSEGSLHPAAQDETKASLFMRKDLDFSNIHVDLTAKAAAIHDSLRAHAFWEYQLPTVAGRKVWCSRILGGKPSGSPGTVTHLDAWHALVSGSDGDVEIRFSPYDEIFAWAKGEPGATAPDWAAVPDLDLMNAKGWSALMVAAFHGNIDAVRALVEAGASLEAANLRGTTPLMYAFARMNQVGDCAAFTYLLAAGAQADRRDAKGLNISDYAPPELRSDLASRFPSIF
jgi:methionyl-tRNA formyltransferase